MSYKNQVLIWGSSLLFSAALLTTVFNATNPEYNFPGITETLLIGISLLLVANSLFLGKSLTQREWVLGGILLALIGTLAIRYLFGWSDPETIASRRCFWMPGYFGKLECLLQLPFKSHYGLRQLLFHFTALSVFLGVASLSRMSGSLRTWVLIPLAVPAVIIALGVFAPVYQDTNFTLTGFNFVFGTHGAVRGRGVIANPSWLWPWLAPAMGIGLATVFAKNWALKAVGLALFVLCAWASLSVMQRGGYLIVGVLLVALILSVLYYFGAKWSKMIAWSMVGSGSFGLGYFVYDSSRIMMIFNWLRQIGLTIKGAPLQRSHERLRMWDVAWEQSIQDNLWLGTGYGTWLREFSKLSGSGGVSFDTAHNLWVQLIFELGAIHVVVMAIILGMIVWTTLFYKNVEQPSLQIGGLFLIIGFLVASVVQEIDYIMPVYMQFAVFAGLCFGGTSYTESRSSSRFQVSSNNDDQKSDSEPDIRNQKSEINKLAWSLVGIGLLCVIGAFYYASSISWGGYGFDPTSTAFSRWFRPKGSIAATPDGRDKVYSVYWGDLDQLKQDSFSVFGKINPDVLIQGNTLFLKNGSKLKPRQYWYESQKQVHRPQRITSFSLHQPPGQTNVILAAQKGMYSWELGNSTQGIQVGKWCEQSCRFFLYRPDGVDKPHGVTLQMPLPGIDENNPVHLIVRIQSVTAKMSSLDSEKLKQMLNTPLTEGPDKMEIVFRQPEDVYPLPVDFRKHKLWLISLKTDRVIVPKEHNPESSDIRKLGVRVLF
ncbi:MAG TPA: O-antigen ligase domain-containing protein [Deltaproteobacteria bacterium]|nr:O-antigen ligase domain-containing protein [Deltaproteobacteria bacterium]